ncbi:HlyD family efflux transporter periplasmic adaptor subunit [Janthinobacterium sp. 17J80-10]|uniref:efflux RND transporter periplasmic adaptor subunit n=1 Tax=Janthinobacterium sp. 17J80-10 TaxID=2497863 RepID=UPI0010055D45|nr:HlyD family efflux transporter periplasmic adaptor subunit [Janthinobacterium sp. 17J80-10]QAU34526.1 HlyD family efflux transporter periplasmic adaptor subunit [Janthinobacterium sp. 17J80-10]
MSTVVQWRRATFLVLITALIAWGLYIGFRRQPVEVEVGTARHGPLQVTVQQEGRTRVVDRYAVTAPVSGYARRIQLAVGDAVERGAMLVELEPARAEILDARRRAEAQARIAAAATNVNVAEQRVSAAVSNADIAQKELQRVRALRQGGHVSAAAEDRAATTAQSSAAELRSARFSVSTARYELEAARTALKYAALGGTGTPIAVRSPESGQVLKIAHKSEGTVAAGQPLIEIGNPRALEVEVDLLSADAVRIHPGTRVLFERWGGDGVLEGVVKVVEPGAFTKISALGVEEQRVWVIVAFTSPSATWQRLGDGYRVEASFIIWEGNDVLQIPASALFRDGNGWAAYVVMQDHAVKRRVEIGKRNALAAQVLAGIRADEQVIVHPDDRVRENVTVAAK